MAPRKRKAADAAPAPPSEDNALLRMLGKRPSVKEETVEPPGLHHDAVTRMQQAMMREDAQSLSLGVSVCYSALLHPCVLDA